MEPSIQSFELEESQWLSFWEKLRLSVNSPGILLLSGPMGSGKTTSIRYFCKGLGVAQVQSPTYSFCNEYQAEDGLQTSIFHYDLYRVKDLDDLESLGFWDQLQRPGWHLIEWPEVVPMDQWPLDQLRGRLSYQQDSASSIVKLNAQLVI